MKRFHVHVGVENIDQSIRFYSGLFGAPPTVRKDDYAKWMIEDPRVNFAISRRDNQIGVNHLGLQVDSADELSDVRARFAAAGATVTDEPNALCCYAKGDKHWVTDPQGIAWEGYHTLGAIRYFDRDEAPTPMISIAERAETAPCCAPVESAAARPAKSDGCCGA